MVGDVREEAAADPAAPSSQATTSSRPGVSRSASNASRVIGNSGSTAARIARNAATSESVSAARIAITALPAAGAARAP
jgi:hypothetical protein